MLAAEVSVSPVLCLAYDANSLAIDLRGKEQTRFKQSPKPHAFDRDGSPKHQTHYISTPNS